MGVHGFSDCKDKIEVPSKIDYDSKIAELEAKCDIIERVYSNVNLSTVSSQLLTLPTGYTYLNTCILCNKWAYHSAPTVRKYNDIRLSLSISPDNSLILTDLEHDTSALGYIDFTVYLLKV